MKKNFKSFYLVIIICFLFSCTEKISYSGKIINLNKDFSHISNKDILILEFGPPSFIDFLEKKYFYYNEKKITKNFFNQKIIERNVISFKFDKNNRIVKINYYNLEDGEDLKFLKKKTKNKILERGLIEKIFGGVGKKPISNTP